MAEFLRNNLPNIRFIYGLIFFTLGLAIVLQPRRNSVYYLATALSWLSAFALVHAFADWGLLFIPFHQRADHPHVINQMLLVRGMAIVLSFGLLSQFGLSLLLEKRPRLRWVNVIPSAVTGVFLLLYMFELGSTSGDDFLITRITSRYFLGFPAAVLSAWGLLTQVRTLKQDQLAKHVGYVYGAAACFVLYSIVGGLIVPTGDFFPADTYNEDTFFSLFHMPVEVARGLAVAGLTYFTVRLLDIFHVETQRRLQAAEQGRALLWERERIARELHDGIMQTLYGTGLGLKQMRTLVYDNGPQAAILNELNREIGRAIVQMRRFVLDLKEQSVTCSDLAEAVRSLTREVEQFAGIRVQVDVEFPEEDGIRVPAGVREEILSVLREGLSNVVRHSGADEVRVLCAIEDDTALLRISDTGCGFDPSIATVGRGLESARERAEALGGFLQVHSAIGQGTQLVAHLPVSRTGRRSGKGART
ncbi:MAG TPA: sensor histidine kinase [Symbiobacteriaceae bacterium]|nr:sensor histidine kinase [Symbiobacteriaceae bacterium]